jgi:RNA polymerase sigma factor (sigma-70 family)
VSDGELIQQLLSNHPLVSEKAWQKIYNLFFPAVENLITRSSGSEQDAVDIFQDTLIVLNSNIRRNVFKGQSSLKTYIYSIARNLWYKQLKQRGTQVPLDENDQFASEDDIAGLANEELISRLLQELKPDCREILIEFYVNNRSMSELMTMFNVNSIQAAKNKKWRCLGYLVKLFREKGVNVPLLAYG